MPNNTIIQKNEIIQLKYVVELNIEEKDLEYDVEKIILDKIPTSKDEKIQAENDKIEEEEFAKDWSKFWKKRIEKENLQTSTYLVNSSSIRYIRHQNQRQDEFIRIIPKSGIILTLTL